MRPVPTSILLALLISLCALCAWQWHRENALRSIVSEQSSELTQLSEERVELETRVKASDAEILRLTGTVEELRVNSVARPQHEEVVQANTLMREAIEKQNAVIKEQNEALAKANAAIAGANASVLKLTEERDAMAKRVNEVTALYNALAAKGR